MKKLNVILKIGDTVTASLFCGQRVHDKVERIEVCEAGSKYCESVYQHL